MLEVRDQFREYAHFAERERGRFSGAAKVQKMLAAGRVPEDRVPIMHALASERAIYLLRIRYSAGVPLEDLAPECVWIIREGAGRSLAPSRVRLLSAFALLLGVVDEAALRAALGDYDLDGKRSRLTDWVLGVDPTPFAPEDYYDHSIALPLAGSQVLAAAEDGDVEAALHRFVLKEWLPPHFEAGDHYDHEKYDGLWCVEGALMAVRFGIDDAPFRDFPHWPSDLVDAARSGTVFPTESDRDYNVAMLGGES